MNVNEAYTWNFIYDDDTNGHEDDLVGFGNVEQDKVRAIQLLPNRPGLHQYVVSLDAAKGQRPILFRRKSKQVDPLTGSDSSGITTIHCIGWQQTIDGKNIKSMLWVFEDGSCLLTDTDIQDM